MSKKNVNKTKKVQPKKISWLLIPILLIMGVLPTITRLVSRMSMAKDAIFRTGEEQVDDIFLYAKAMFLIGVAILMLGILIWKWFTDRNWPKLNRIFIPLGVYALFVLLSTIFSKNSDISLIGVEDSFESMFVLLSYCILPIYAYAMIRSEEDVKSIMKWWPIGIFVLVFIGITQFVGRDFWSTDIGRKIMLPVSQWGSELKFNFVGGRAYLSQYNPNYVGPLSVMIVLFFGSFTIFTKEWKKRILYGIVTAGMGICLLASQSKNGLISLFLGGILLCIFLHKWIKKYWYVFTTGLVLFLGVVVVMDFSREHFISRALAASFQSITGQSQIDDKCPELEDIVAGKENVAVTYDGNTIYIKGNIKKDDNTLTFQLRDGEDNPISYTYNQETKVAHINDERFSDITLGTTAIEGIRCISINIDGYMWRFSDQIDEQGYYYASPNGVFVKMEVAETSLLKNAPRFASGRGYIWSRSLPMMKDTILLGHGPDGFFLNFPHNDYVAGYKGGYSGKIVGTPHNMFLQIGINTGLISLIGFLGFFILYFIECVKLYRKEDFKTFLPQAGVGICVACFAYIMSGFLNDSMVCVAPVFWCLIGMGLAVNRLYKKEMRL